jgi:hypothetical protein
MLINIMPKSLSMSTLSYRATVSCPRLHRRKRLVHAKRPPRQRLSPGQRSTHNLVFQRA